jgi:hypothetical protein
VEREREEGRPGEHRAAPEEKRLPDDQRDHGDVARVSDPAERPADDEVLGWRDRGGGPVPLADEAREEAEEERRRQDYQRDAERARGLDAEQRRPELPRRQQVRDQDDQRAGDDQREGDRPEEGASGGLHRRRDTTSRRLWVPALRVPWPHG